MMSASSQPSTLARLLVSGLLSSAAAVVPWSLAEILYSLSMVSMGRRLSFAATLLLIYTIPSLAAGLAVGLLAWLFRGRLAQAGVGRPFSVALVFFLPAIFFGWGALLAIGAANIYLLPAAVDPESLAADAGILLGVGLLFAGTVKVLLRSRLYERPGVRAWAAPVSVVVILLIFASLVVVRTAHFQETITESVPAAVTRGSARGPNILIISIDTVRADHLRTYGYARETTPFLDALAREGAFFRNSRSQASWTRSSAASLVTSLFPSTHGTLYLRDAIPKSVTTLFEYMKGAGYTTGIFSGNGNVSATFGFGQGVDAFYESTTPKLLERTVFCQTLLIYA